mgnify:CR=1 FL=1
MAIDILAKFYKCPRLLQLAPLVRGGSPFRRFGFDPPKEYNSVSSFDHPKTSADVLGRTTLPTPTVHEIK